VNVIQVVSSLSSRMGGPTRSIINLSHALALNNITTSIISSTSSKNLFDEGLITSDSLVTYHSLSSGSLFYKRSLIKKYLLSKCNGNTVIHINGIWQPFIHFAFRFASDFDIPIILSPRGMLDPWSLKHHSFRKKIAWLFYQHKDLLLSSVFHATSLNELNSIRSIGLTQPIALVPNGIDFSPYPSLSETRFSHFDFNNDRILLFIGRIHPVKGLKNLIYAWDKLKPSGWRLIIAGPCENSHSDDLQKLVSKLALGDSIDFVGSVNPEEKAYLLSISSLFVLPSFTESFGLAVAEALAAKLPVITTSGTPWNVLESLNCGWCVDPNADALYKALSSALALPEYTLQSMGEIAHQYAIETLSLARVSSDMASVYEWMIFRDDKPSCVN